MILKKKKNENSTLATLKQFIVFDAIDPLGQENIKIIILFYFIYFHFSFH